MKYPNCLFCNNEMVNAAISMDAWFRCTKCRPFVTLSSCKNYCFILDHKDISYFFNFDINDRTFSLYDTKKFIMHLDFWPDITPTNAAHKISTLLTFS